MSDATEVTPQPGLRERKKAMTRAAIIETASRLFEQRGYEKVTVAEIADAANISVKTLFTYFESKEDLVFHGEQDLVELILGLIRNRPPGTSPFDAMSAYIRRVVEPGQSAALEALEGLRLRESNRTLRARLSLMWDRIEDRVSTQLSEDLDRPTDDPICKQAASQLIVPVRLLLSDQLRAHLTSQPARRRKDAFQVWADDALALAGNGISEFGRQPR